MVVCSNMVTVVIVVMVAFDDVLVLIMIKIYINCIVMTNECD